MLPQYLIYNIHVLRLFGQYTELYFDDFANADYWWAIQPSVGYGEYPQCLRTTYCLRLSGIDATASRHSMQTDNNGGYHNIKVTFDINTWDYTSGDVCEVYYRVDSGNWTMMNSYGSADDGNDMEVYPGDDAANSDSLEIQFVNNVQDIVQECYIDSFRVYGIAITPNPTGITTLNMYMFLNHAQKNSITETLTK